MTKHRISDDDAAALLRGDATGVSPELAALAESVSEFRAAAFETTAQPSAAVLARLNLHGESTAVMSTASASRAAAAPAPVGAISGKKRVRRMVSWLAGLGVLAKVILGSTVAFAAVAGAGAAGVLPTPAQDAFDTVVSVVVPATDDSPDVTPTDSPSPEPTDGADSEHPDNFGGKVSEWAHDPNKGDDGPFGEDVSDAAHDKNDLKHHGEESDDNGSDDSGSDDGESDDNGNHGNGNGNSGSGNTDVEDSPHSDSGQEGGHGGGSGNGKKG